LYRKSASRNELIFLLAKKGHKMSLTEYRFFHLLSIEKNKKKKKKKKERTDRRAKFIGNISNIQKNSNGDSPSDARPKFRRSVHHRI
jgi:hypothetical protein